MNLGRKISLDELPDYDVSLVPAGWYAAQIVKCEVKDTKRGDGQYLFIQYSILGPTHQGRSVFGTITLSNPSETATRIGLKQLRELMMAAGLKEISDSRDFVGATLQIRVAVRQDDKYGESNEVKSWKPAGASTPAQPLARPAGFATPVPAPASVPIPPPPPAPEPPVDSPAPRPPLPPWAARK